MRACDSEIIVHAEYLVHGGGGDSLRSCINWRNETTQTSHEMDQAKVVNPGFVALNNLACVTVTDLITFVGLSRATCVRYLTTLSFKLFLNSAVKNKPIRIISLLKILKN